MAEALASILIELLAAAAIEKVNEHVRLAVDARDEVKKLQNTFATLQMVLHDAEQRQFKDELVKHWLNQFKDVAYDMEDVLDEWRTEILQIVGTPPDEKKNDGKYKQMIKEKVSSYLCSPFSTCFRKTALYYAIGSRIKEIRVRLGSIYDEQTKFGFIKSSQTTTFEQTCQIPDYRKTSRIIDDDSGLIIGRDWDKKIILDRLFGRSSSSSNPLENETFDSRIISIIGMGGLGKTTLAQGIINDAEVKTHFSKTMWVCVSEPFDLTRIAKAIIEEAGENLPASSEWNALHVKLCDSIEGKLFLLVLDDVWTEDEDHWKPLRNLLNHGAIGSRILVSTRSDKVAKMMNSYQYPLDILSSDDCWTLLSRKAFEGRKREEIEVLQDTSIEIAKKCKGLPLAACILGCLLKKRKTEREWLHVLKSPIWELEDDQEIVEEKLFKPLMLSYDDLQPPVKRCFAYCAIFPKNHRIKKQTLIRMWMAHGFLNSRTRKNLDPKSAGEKYFDDLLEGSFFQDDGDDDMVMRMIEDDVDVDDMVMRMIEDDVDVDDMVMRMIHDDNDDGSTIHYKMHDIVHEFAQFLLKNELYVKQTRDDILFNGVHKVRHLTLTNTTEDEEVASSFFHYASIFKAKYARSLLVSLSSSNHIKPSWKDSLSNLFCHLRCLRVLKLKRMDLTHLPSEMKKLIHLRYLDLSSNLSLTTLPDSICSLYNLETLKLKGCEGLCEIPRGMGRMINLKHLDIRNTNVAVSLPEGSGRLTSYNSLHVCGGSIEGCNVKQLKDVNLLQRCIEVRGLGGLGTTDEASQIGGVDEENLDAVVLVVEITKGLVGVLQPHLSFKKLTISNYSGLKLGSWIASLTHLRVLELSNIHNCTELPALGLLPSLEDLRLKHLSNLKRIGVEIYGTIAVGNVFRDVVFPKLREIFILSTNLEEWDILGDGKVARKIMPNVTSITITSKKLKALPAVWKLSSLETLIIKGSTMVTHIGPEFYGIVDTVVGGSGSLNLTAFPYLKQLRLEYMEGLEEFDLGVKSVDLKGKGNRDDQIIVMPRLKHITIYECSKLKTVRTLSKLDSLEVLEIHDVFALEAIEVVAEKGRQDTVYMPSLQSFEISLCPKLKSLQQLHLPKLIYLRIMYCGSLLQLPIAPNLTSLEIFSSSQPQGLPGFGKLQHLCFYKCSFLACILEDVRNLTALQTLEIQKCDWPPEIINPDRIIDLDEVFWGTILGIPRVIIKGSTYKLIS